MKRTLTEKIATAGIIGALYALLTFVTYSFSGGAIQLRVSEGLCILPLFLVEAPFGLFVGCLLSNLIIGCPLLDVIGGSLITLVAGVLTYLTARLIKNKILVFIIGGLFPVILNAFLLPLIWYFYGQLHYLYIIQVLFLLASQSLSVYLIGGIIYAYLVKTGFLSR